jgi:hypothetical protein
MKNKINFPVIYQDKVYYNIEEVPEEIRKILESEPKQENEYKYLSQHWEINGIIYTNFDDIPLEYKKYLEDKNKNGIPDLIEDKVDLTKNDTKKTVIKNLSVNDLSSPHKTTYSKNTQQKKDYNPLIIILLLLIIIILIVYIAIKS